MNSQRFIFIDYCKTIAIILVLLGHKDTPLSDKSIDVIYTFHMPLFFFISGFLFKRYDWITQLQRMKKGIVTPLFFFIFFSYITLYAPRNILHHNYTDIYSFIHIMLFIPIKDTIKGLSVCDNGSIWFIYSLILCIITFRILSEKILYYLRKYLYIFLIIVPLLSMGWCFIFTGSYPWNIQRHFIICSIFILGYSLNPYIKKINSNNIKSNKFLILLVLSFIFFFIVYSNSNNITRWYNYSISIISSYQTFILTLMGIIFVLTLSIILAKLFGKNKYIEFISNNTYTIFATECVWQWNLHRVELITTTEFTALQIVILRFILSCIFAYYMNKYFPSLIGNKKK